MSAVKRLAWIRHRAAALFAACLLPSFVVRYFVVVGSASAAIAWGTPDAPLVCFQDINRGKWLRQLPAKSGSLVDIAEPNVVLIGAKQSEDSGGLILRLWETSGKATTTHVRLRHLPASRATAGNLVEQRQGPLEFKNGTVTVPLRGAGLATVIIE